MPSFLDFRPRVPSGFGGGRPPARRRHLQGWFLPLAVVGLGCILPLPARANGRFPTANQLVVDPNDPAHIVVRATIGILQSTDSGKTWSWICESAYSKLPLSDDPAIGLTADGSLLVGGSNGMSRGTMGGCAFATPTGSLVDQTVIDLAVEPSNRADAYAIYGMPPDLPTSAKVARTTDNGATWSDVGTTVDDFSPTTIDVAPSNPDVLYASGTDAVAAKQLFFRSTDAGQTWKRIVIPGMGNVFIAAVDPMSADTIYARTDAAQSHLVESDDGGETFHDILVANGLLVGFALSPDGQHIAAGSEEDGVFLLTRAAGDAGTWTTEMIRPFNVICMTWGSAGLYACSNEQRDGFAIGLSPDVRQPFTPVLLMSDVRPLVCPNAPSRCDLDWCTVAPKIGVDAGCGSAPGAVDGGGEPPGDAMPPDASPGGGDGGPSPPAMSSNGCGCRLGVGRGSEGSILGMFLWAVVVRARHRKRTSRAHQNGMADRG
jgi:photosystem II stability/assembly factor-like uncharacterized protein